MVKKTSQIWIETVIYTLIGLAIIGIMLSIVKPAIDEKKDQLLIERSLEMIGIIQDNIEEVVNYGVGNTRPVELKITKGVFEIKGAEDRIEFSTESSYMYSEPGKSIMVGSVNVTTIKKNSKYKVSLIVDYSNLNLTWKGRDVTQSFQPSPTPYNVWVTNNGKNVLDAEDLIRIDFS